MDMILSADRCLQPDLTIQLPVPQAGRLVELEKKCRLYSDE